MCNPSGPTPLALRTGEQRRPRRALDGKQLQPPTTCASGLSFCPAAFMGLDEDASGKIDVGEVKKGLEEVGMVRSAAGGLAQRVHHPRS